MGSINERVVAEVIMRSGIKVVVCRVLTKCKTGSTGNGIIR